MRGVDRGTPSMRVRTNSVRLLEATVVVTAPQTASTSLTENKWLIPSLISKHQKRQEGEKHGCEGVLIGRAEIAETVGLLEDRRIAKHKRDEGSRDRPHDVKRSEFRAMFGF